MSLDQRGVDEVRQRIMGQLLVTHVQKRDPKPPLYHLRFLRDTINSYGMREGNPPADHPKDRHPWERGLRLEIDLGPIDPWVSLFVLNAIAERRMAGERQPNKDLWEACHCAYLQAKKHERKMHLVDPGQKRIWTPKERVVPRARRVNEVRVPLGPKGLV